MIPIRDGIPTRRFPVVTVLFILINIGVFGVQMFVLGSRGEGALQQALFTYGLVPARVAEDLGPATWLSFLTSMFMHGGIMHIASNLLYLWIFGNNVEDVMGRFWFIIFYLAAGFAASLAQVFASWGSSVPGIGASGAIAGVLAAYLLFFPGARVQTLILLGYFGSIRSIPAIIVLGLWFVLQLVSGFLSFGNDSGGVAWFAHIGGFVAGLIFALPWIAKARRMSWQHHYR